MSKLKNIFKKKLKKVENPPRQPEGYVTVEASNLNQMPISQLVNIIYRYDAELRHLNSAAEGQSSQLTAATSSLTQLQEELSLHKEHNEKLNQECHNAITGLSQSKESLESKEGEMLLLRSQLESMEELVSNFKTQLSELSKQLEEQHLAEAQSEDSSYLSMLKAEIVRLKASQQDIRKEEQQRQELTIKNKMLESECAKSQLQVQSLQSQMSALDVKLSEFERKRQSQEMRVFKLEIELESEQKNQGKLSFQKESVETALQTAQESCNRKDTKIQKSKAKFLNLREQLKVKIEEIYELKNKLESLAKDHKESLEATECEVQSRAQEQLAQVSALQCKLKELEDQQEPSLDHSYLKYEENELRTENEDLKTELSSLRTANTSLAKTIQDLKLKQDAAKSEVIKLSQKLESKEKALPTAEFRIATSNVSFSDLQPLTALKKELEEIYRTLMNLMFSSPPTSSEISIKQEDFSAFERRLNNLLMQVHEAVELSQQNPVSWASKLTGATVGLRSKQKGPLKLFSCMRVDDDPRPIVQPRTIYGRRLAANTGGHPNREYPNNPAIVSQRRGSVGYGKLS